MDLFSVRKRLDEIDAQLLDLFCERMRLAAEVAAAKKETGRAVFDPAREREKLAAVADRAPDALVPQAVALFSLLMSMNKAEQMRILAAGDPQGAAEDARAALKPADEPFPARATIACQGVEGAYSQIAASRLFRLPSITFFASFDGVCRAVRDGLVRYGVLPIENSTAGSVNAVYDLLAAYRFHIVRSIRLKIDHNLLAKPGARLEDIREVWSHEQAIAQCAGYLDRLGVRVHVCENTAQAAEAVARAERDDVAALSSRACAGLYGLDVVDEDVQDSDNNYTRFVVISAEPEIYAGATRASLMLTVSHEPGSLYRVLERFYALGINLVKLESRPIPGRDFEFVFYFDLDCPVSAPSFIELLNSLGDVCERYWYFGSYTEVL
ncbi:bifunctional chorismate mutase/prephenate dehydratase [Collinsella intestinalis]|uniref:bifunctional chorismate mutase/prephenate dehydratase n=1 Tax=Collinsella intestinalis TaxID=147207 RepID=UPI0025A4BDAF|nr:bifunctional chorismate mutase/prephenate dehydratase [Collinsella intestinalis]MDM8163744.1 prephenate dehydratase domain-containing protein [Collinsella intestinalis]